MFAIGITDRVDVRQLKDITDDRQKVVTIRGYNQLDYNLLTKLGREVCGQKKIAVKQALEKSLEYYGCFKENVIRQLPKLVIGHLQQTPKTCLDACIEVGRDTAGLFIGSQCWCGDKDSLRESNREQSEVCDFYKCIGNLTAPCGGPGFVMAVYLYEDILSPVNPTWSIWSSTSQPSSWNQWGSWSAVTSPSLTTTTFSPWSQWGSWSRPSQWGSWSSWNGVNSVSSGRKRDCPMDVVIVSDWSLPEKRFEEIMSNVMQVIDQRGQKYVRYAVAIVDRNRDLKILHNFEDSQNVDVIRDVLLRSRFLNSQQPWSRIGSTLRQNDNREKRLIYLVGSENPGAQFTVEARILNARGIPVIPVHYGDGSLPRNSELLPLVGRDPNKILHNPGI